VSTETIYQSLYVQSRGALKRELTRYLRTGRSLRKPGRQVAQRTNRIPDMVSIAERPPDDDERRVPGHWEGDLLIGKRNATAIATLVERLQRLRHARGAARRLQARAPRPGARAQDPDPPGALRRSLTWDQGPEMREWKQVHVDAGIEVFFCDPRSPWQRGTNENTNGLLRQYFPKGFDFSTVTEVELDAVADELNQRPRKRFGFATPTEQLSELLLQLTARIRRSAYGTVLGPSSRAACPAPSAFGVVELNGRSA
jgi:transposase, IS30 family